MALKSPRPSWRSCAGCASYARRLFDDCLPFWLQHGVDFEHGGLMTCLDRQGNVVDSDKAVWLQGRFAWLMAHLCNTVAPQTDWQEAATRTALFMREHCFDSDNRMFFHVTRDGRPIRKRRYAFAESFAAIAFAEMARLTQEDTYAGLAVQCFQTFSTHQPDPKYTTVRPLKSMAKPMIEIVTCQCLRAAIDFPQADTFIDRAINEIVTDFMKPDLQCCMENVAPTGAIVDHLDGRILNPGHAIEGAWFMMQEGKLRHKLEYVRHGLDILDWMWQRGWDDKHGGLFYYRDLKGLPVAEYWQDMKFWWPQNEALIATLLAYQLTREPRYLEQHRQLHTWYESFMVDHEYGECYGYLSRAGRVTTPLKGTLFKGCFHYPRQLLHCLRLCDEMLAGDAR